MTTGERDSLNATQEEVVEVVVGGHIGAGEEGEMTAIGKSRRRSWTKKRNGRCRRS